MKLSTRVRYGCRAMVNLALRQADGPVPLDELASDQKIPSRYLGKIVQDLRRSGLIRSVRGPRGGYLLGRAASQISLLDVWVALEGRLEPVDCLERPEGCDMLDECVMRPVWARLRDAMQQVLASETLAGLARRYRKEAGGRARRRAVNE